MIIKTFIEPPLENNNYLIVDEESKEAALVDCSSFDIWDKISVANGTVNSTVAGKDRAELSGIKLKYILLTHGHFDHIAGIKQNGVPVVMHREDIEQINNANDYLATFGLPMIAVPKIDIYVKDGDILQLGKYEIKVMHTAGHTQGGVCYYVEGNLFSGDTIFRESVGRCDLAGGNFNQIVDSITTKIFTLPEETVIYPGHGNSTTVGWEKIHNKFM